jgi:hypothetical protein
MRKIPKTSWSLQVQLPDCRGTPWNPVCPIWACWITPSVTDGSSIWGNRRECKIQAWNFYLGARISLGSVDDHPYQRHWSALGRNGFSLSLTSRLLPIRCWLSNTITSLLNLNNKRRHDSNSKIYWSRLLDILWNQPSLSATISIYTLLQVMREKIPKWSAVNPKLLITRNR